MIVITQPTYLPWSGYFDLLDRSETFVFLDDVQFNKRSWQQKNRIILNNDYKDLTIPVKKKGLRFQKIKDSKLRKSLISGLRIGGGLGKALIKGSILSSSTSYTESSFNIRFPFGLKIGPFLTSIGYETSKYSFASSPDTLDSYYGSGSGVIINVDLSKIIKIGGENLVKEFVVGSQNYDHGTGLMAGYNVNLLLGSLPCSISMASRFNTLKFNNSGTSYWGSFYVGMGIDFL